MYLSQPSALADNSDLGLDYARNQPHPIIALWMLKYSNISFGVCYNKRKRVISKIYNHALQRVILVFHAHS